MSATEESESDTMQRCASCGTAGSDDIQLKRCNGCYLVRYCSVKCQKDHRPKHKKECKKRAAELRDELLFKQPESSHVGDCQICCLPLQMDPEKSGLSGCCCKRICNGCNFANQKREVLGRLQNRCAFCRTAMPETDEEYIRRLMKRVEANDPIAISHMGTLISGEGDDNAAFEYWTRAAPSGDAAAHFQLSRMYSEGKFVEKDEKKELHHEEQAAIAGHPNARHNLGWTEKERGRVDRAAKHWIIAAKLGFEKSLNSLKDLYKDGDVSKEDFNAALRGYQAAIDATKSPQREEANKYKEWLKTKGIKTKHPRA